MFEINSFVNLTVSFKWFKLKLFRSVIQFSMTSFFTPTVPGSSINLLHTTSCVNTFFNLFFENL
jgi:hypothetical protein